MTRNPYCRCASTGFPQSKAAGVMDASALACGASLDLSPCPRPGVIGAHARVPLVLGPSERSGRDHLE